MKKEKVKVIDLTPTWEEVVGALLVVIKNGNSEGRKIAEQEIRNMAKVADLHVKMTDAEKVKQEKLEKLSPITRKVYNHLTEAITSGETEIPVLELIKVIRETDQEKQS